MATLYIRVQRVIGQMMMLGWSHLLEEDAEGGWAMENKELETFVDVYSGTRRHEKEKNQLRRMPISSTKPVMKDMN